MEESRAYIRVKGFYLGYLQIEISERKSSEGQLLRASAAPPAC